MWFGTFTDDTMKMAHAELTKSRSVSLEWTREKKPCLLTLNPLQQLALLLGEPEEFPGDGQHIDQSLVRQDAGTLVQDGQGHVEEASNLVEVRTMEKNSSPKPSVQVLNGEGKKFASSEELHDRNVQVALVASTSSSRQSQISSSFCSNAVLVRHLPVSSTRLNCTFG